MTTRWHAVSFFKKTGDQKRKLNESSPPPATEFVVDSGTQVDIIDMAHIVRLD